LSSTTYLAWAAWAPFFTLVVCWRRQQFIFYIRRMPVARESHIDLRVVPRSIAHLIC
jgi:hypothetical protein